MVLFPSMEEHLEDYFPSEIHKIIIKQPLVLVESDGKYDIKINVNGGGFKGQAEAIRSGCIQSIV